MSTPLDAAAVLNREFLEIRARLLQLAASLDRLDRADGSATSDGRLDKIRQGLEILGGDESDRAEKIQLLFSRPYESDWMTALEGSRRQS